MLKKMIIFFISTVLLIGCGNRDRSAATDSKGRIVVSCSGNGCIDRAFEKICIEGVVYLFYRDGMTPMFGKDSKVILCNE